MKKVIVLFVAAMLVLLTACQSEANITVTPDPPPAPPEQAPAPESAQPAEPAQPTEPPAPSADEITFTTSVFEVGESRAEYIVVSGLSDPAVEQNLNDELRMFTTWILEAESPYADEPDSTLISTAQAAIVGDYISLRSEVVMFTEGAAHPTISLQTQVFDLTTGLAAGPLDEFVVVGDELRRLMMLGEFTQVYPDMLEGGIDRLIAEFIDNRDPGFYETRFYFTENSLGLHFETLHVEGGYWAFEARFSDITAVLTDRLIVAID